MEMIKQEPKVKGNWLYHDENDTRLFTKIAYLGVNAEPWPECTDEEKTAWEEAHKPEPEPAEVLN